MCKESILAPEIGLIKSDEFYLFYEMMMQSLKTDDVKEGINKSLFMLRHYLNSGNIALFRKKDNGQYVYKMSDSLMSELIQPVGCIINKTSPLIENKGIMNIDINVGRLDNIMFIHTGIGNKFDDHDDCILAIINNNKEKELEPQFWDRVKDTMTVILKRAASYERNTKALTSDLLTGLENRNSYELRMQQINEEDNNLVLGIFDLFRLKHINDNYTHNKGDLYIKEAAKVLNKYWPKQKVIVNDDCTESYEETGHAVYRYGGDEFVLLTTVEGEQLANIKADLAQAEVRLIDLKIGNNIPIGINYGIVKHNPGNSIKVTFAKADEIMQEHKSEMYKKLKLDRRRN
jgi:diguanylate cyclase (GGDEF)-like protein